MENHFHQIYTRKLICLMISILDFYERTKYHLVSNDIFNRSFIQVESFTALLLFQSF